MEPDVGTGLGELNTESKIFPPHHLKENTSWILDNLQIISFPRPFSSRKKLTCPEFKDRNRNNDM